MSDDLLPLIAAECRRLHTALATLPADAWDGGSLCEGWTIRHVIAHLTMPARFTPDEFAAELASAGYDFTTLSNRIADRDSTLPVEQLLADLASDTLAQWVTPEGGQIGSLTHVVIHGLDATIPAGLGSVVSAEALRLVLDNLAIGGVHRHFGTSIDGRRMEAEDLDWSHGSGARETAPAHRLVLAFAARAVPTPSPAPASAGPADLTKLGPRKRGM